jgi:hypothetical protein
MHGCENDGFWVRAWLGKAVIVLHLDKDNSEEGKQDVEAFGEGDGWREGQLRSGLVETIEMPLNRRTIINFNAEKQPGKGKPGHEHGFPCSTRICHVHAPPVPSPHTRTTLKFYTSPPLLHHRRPFHVPGKILDFIWIRDAVEVEIGTRESPAPESFLAGLEFILRNYCRVKVSLHLGLLETIFKA